MSDEATRAVLEAQVGEWEGDVVIVPFPGGPEIRHTATRRGRLVAGRWLVVDHVTDSGFEGHGTYGWDAARSSYVGSWVDAALPGVATAHGEWDGTTWSLAYEATTATRTLRYRETLTPHGDVLEYTNVQPAGDGEHVLIRATFRRR